MSSDPDPAFLDLMRGEEETLLRAARLLTGDWDRAEDLLRETLSWALATWPTLEVTDGGAAARSRTRQRMVSIYLAGQPAAGTDGDGEPHGVAEARESGDSLVGSLARLDAEERTVVVSRYYLDLSAGQIGEVLGADAEDVATAAVRVLAALRWSG